MSKTPIPSTSINPEARRRNSAYAAILGALTALFALRVAGQAIQRWAPVSFLPAFDAFQGSNLSYPVLLGSQLVLLAVMLALTARIYRGADSRPRLARVLAWAGGLYMGGSIARIAVGFFMPGAPGWFTAWIPGVFHLVLAGFMLTVAFYYRPPTKGTKEEPRA